MRGGGPAEAPVLPAVEDYLAEMGDCILQEPGDELDLQAGCALGACVGDTLAEISAALAAEPVCDVYGTGEAYCGFRGLGIRTLSAAFPDEAEPDPDAVVISLWVSGEFVGADSEGLGLGTGMRCFVDQQGMPDKATLGPGADGWGIAEATWYDLGIVVRDGAAPWIQTDVDGSVDQITFFIDE